MSDFTFLCPNCQGNIQAGSEHAGMEVDCPLCHAKLIIPQPPAAVGAPQPQKGKLQMAASTTEHKTQGAAPPPPPRKKKKKISPGVIIWPIVGVAAVVAGIFYGPALYHKYQAKKEAEAQAEEVAKNPPPPPEPSSAEIVTKMQNKYKEMTSFSATGKTSATLDMSALVPNNPALASVNLMADTHIRMARPDLYRVEWSLQSGGSAAIKGAVWSAGKGNYAAIGSPYPVKAKDRKAALAQTEGSSGTLAILLVELFFSDQDAAGDLANGLTKTNAQSLNGQECFVLTGEQNATRIELWVNKKNFLVAQAEVILGGQLDDAAYKAQTNAVVKAQMLRLSKIKGTITETYQDIDTGKQFTATDFDKPIDAASQTSTQMAPQMNPAERRRPRP